MDLARFPRRRYTDGATPIEFLANLTRVLDGPKIYMKRDDLLGLAGGGNKTRKLVRTEKFRRDDNALFLHTGGSPALYAYRSVLLGDGL